MQRRRGHREPRRRTVILDEAGIQQLTERIAGLEKRIEQLGGIDAARLPSEPEVTPETVVGEQHQQFLNQVWNMP